MKKLPWVSLTLLWVSYYSFSWLLFSSIPAPGWGIAVVLFALVLAVLLTTPPSSTAGRLVRWAVSRPGAFLAAVCGAFLAAMLLYLIHIFAQILILISAGILARLDLLTAEYSPPQSFAILSLISLSGAGLAWLVFTFA